MLLPPSRMTGVCGVLERHGWPAGDRSKSPCKSLFLVLRRTTSSLCTLRLKGVLCFDLRCSRGPPVCPFFVTGGAHEIIDLAPCSSSPPSTPTLPLYLCVHAEYKCEAAREALLRPRWTRSHGTFIRMYILLSTSAISNAIPFTSTDCFRKTTGSPRVHHRYAACAPAFNQICMFLSPCKGYGR